MRSPWERVGDCKIQEMAMQGMGEKLEVIILVKVTGITGTRAKGVMIRMTTNPRMKTRLR